MIPTASLPIQLTGPPRTASTDTAPRERPYAGGRGGIIDVSRPAVPWRWRTVVADLLSIVAVAWSFPVVVLAVGTPVALAIVLLLWSGRRILGAF